MGLVFIGAVLAFKLSYSHMLGKPSADQLSLVLTCGMLSKNFLYLFYFVYVSVLPVCIDTHHE